MKLIPKFQDAGKLSYTTNPKLIERMERDYREMAKNALKQCDRLDEEYKKRLAECDYVIEDEEEILP